MSRVQDSPFSKDRVRGLDLAAPALGSPLPSCPPASLEPSQPCVDEEQHEALMGSQFHLWVLAACGDRGMPAVPSGPQGSAREERIPSPSRS